MSDAAGPEPPEELLSAYLDDELSADERTDVEAWLAADPTHRDELDAIGRVRGLVRGLPRLEMPAELSPAVTALGGRRTAGRRHGRSARRANLFAGLTATLAVFVLAGALVLGGGQPADAAVIPVERAVEVHDEGQWPQRDTAHEDVTAPLLLDGYVIVGVSLSVGGMIGMHYSNGSSSFSVFERPGRVDWSALTDGERGHMQGDPTWRGTVRGYDVLVLQRKGRVYMVIGDDRSDTEQVSREMPGENGPSVWDRVTRRCHDTLRVFSAS